MLLAVLNQSSQLTPADAQAAVGACASQLKLHVAPVWDMVPAPVILYESAAKIPAGADQLVILDNSDQAGALGYHRVTPEGVPYSRVFVSPILDHGGTPLTGNLAVSSTISHEVCEWFVDRFLNLWADGPEGQYPLEVCDPVQDQSYEIDGVALSNFLMKRYFDQSVPSGTKLDYLGSLTKPFTYTDGGYLLVRRGSKVDQQVGARYPDWKLAMKDFPAGRTARRVLVGGG